MPKKNRKKNRKGKCCCPQCGNREMKHFSLEHENDVREDLMVCNKCGHQASKKAFTLSESNPFTKKADGNFSDNKDKQPSNKTCNPCNKNNPKVMHSRDNDKKFRIKPEERITKDPENVRRVSMTNPFVKESIVELDSDTGIVTSPNKSVGILSKFKKDDRVVLVGDKKLDDLQREMGSLMPALTVLEVLGGGKVRLSNQDIVNEKDIEKTTLAERNPFAKKSKIEENKMKKQSETNPFIKKAREFRLNDQQKERKKDRNLLFPDGYLGDDEDRKEKGSGNGINGGQQETVFDTIDRKERRNSDNPRDFLPGHKEWEDREVDHYYDGWVEDHIENSGGSVPGSNTEKIMNLEDGERAHDPEYPLEAIYEKLLENRHNFNEDYVEVVAEGKTYKIKTADAQVIMDRGEQQGSLDEIERVIAAFREGDQFAENLVRSSIANYFRTNPEQRGEFCGGTSMMASTNPFTKNSKKKRIETVRDVKNGG